MQFERSEDHLILHALMVKAEPGEMITYAAMNAATGKVITGTFGPLQSVLRRLINEDGMVFGNQPKIGYRRLTPQETVDEAYGKRGALHRHAHRNTKRLVTVDADFASLDEDRRVSYAVGLSLFNAILAATTKQAAKRIEASVRRTDMRPLPFTETLAAFSQK